MHIRTLKSRKKEPTFDHEIITVNDIEILFIKDFTDGIGTAYTINRRSAGKYDFSISAVTADTAKHTISRVCKFIDKYSGRQAPAYLYGLLCNHRLMSVIPITNIPSDHRHYLKMVVDDLYEYKSSQIIMPNAANQFPWETSYNGIAMSEQKVYADVNNKRIATMEVLGDFKQ